MDRCNARGVARERDNSHCVIRVAGGPMGEPTSGCSRRCELAFIVPNLQMLTEFLSEHPEIVRDVLSNEAAFESTTQPDRTRRDRLHALLVELTDMLGD